MKIKNLVICCLLATTWAPQVRAEGGKDFWGTVAINTVSGIFTFAGGVALKLMFEGLPTKNQKAKRELAADQISQAYTDESIAAQEAQLKRLADYCRENPNFEQCKEHAALKRALMDTIVKQGALRKELEDRRFHEKQASLGDAVKAG